MKAFLLLFFIGAVAGTFLDWLHTHAGIAVYINPTFLDTPWWVPFLFGVGVVLIAWTHFKIHPMPPQPKRVLISSLVALFFACWTTSRPTVDNVTKVYILLTLYLISWGILDRTRKSIGLAIGTAIIGSLAESLWGAIGIYYYQQPDLLGVPYWLPFLYFHVSQTVGFLGRFLLRKREVDSPSAFR